MKEIFLFQGFVSGVMYIPCLRGQSHSRCGDKPLLQVLRESRLRWFGHVKRRRGAGVSGEVMEMEVTGTRPRARLKEAWMKNIEENLKELNLTQDDAYDRDR